MQGPLSGWFSYIPNSIYAQKSEKLSGRKSKILIFPKNAFGSANGEYYNNCLEEPA